MDVVLFLAVQVDEMRELFVRPEAAVLAARRQPRKDVSGPCRGKLTREKWYERIRGGTPEQINYTIGKTLPGENVS